MRLHGRRIWVDGEEFAVVDMSRGQLVLKGNPSLPKSHAAAQVEGVFAYNPVTLKNTGALMRFHLRQNDGWIEYHPEVLLDGSWQNCCVEDATRPPTLQPSPAEDHAPPPATRSPAGD